MVKEKKTKKDRHAKQPERLPEHEHLGTPMAANKWGQFQMHRFLSGGDPPSRVMLRERERALHCVAFRYLHDRAEPGRFESARYPWLPVQLDAQ